MSQVRMQCISSFVLRQRRAVYVDLAHGISMCTIDHALVSGHGIHAGRVFSIWVTGTMAYRVGRRAKVRMRRHMQNHIFGTMRHFYQGARSSLDTSCNGV